MTHPSNKFERRCSKCKKEKELSEFPKHSKTKSGLCSWCKECHRKRMREFAEENPKELELRSFRRGLKTARVSHKELLDHFNHRQSFKCGICKQYLKTFDLEGDLINAHCERGFIDHDHKRSTFRGLLCRKCNTGLGMFKDDPDLLNNAIHYLNETSI